VLTLSTWTRGIRISSVDDPSMFVYFWFYEWNMFGAIEEGEHTRGRWDWSWELDPSGREARIAGRGIALSACVEENSVALDLRVTNTTGHTWDAPAAIIPCFNPGDGREVERNERLVDENHQRTWFVGRDGLDRLHQREIHFNDALRREVDPRAVEGRHVFADKWPPSDRDAIFGALVRSSSDDRWVAAIAWDDFLSAQGHNPWFCMHLSVRLGPLAPGATVHRHGRMDLFPGTPTEALARARSLPVDPSS